MHESWVCVHAFIPQFGFVRVEWKGGGKEKEIGEPKIKSNKCVRVEKVYGEYYLLDNRRTEQVI